MLAEVPSTQADDRGLKLTRTLLALSLSLMLGGGAVVSAQVSESSGSLARTEGSQGEASKLFGVGRAAIQEERWDAAEANFSSFLEAFPSDGNAVAASYWLAYALRKQGKLREADRRAEALIKSYPDSGWAQDALALRVEVAQQLGNGAVVEQALAADSDELRLLGLKGLLQSDPARATAQAAAILRDEKRARPALKEAVIALLGRLGGGPEATRLLADAVRQQTDPKLRKAAMLSIGRTESREALESLKEVVNTSHDAELVGAAIIAIARLGTEPGRAALLDFARSAPSTTARMQAIEWLARRGGEGVVESLLGIYGAERDAAMKKQIVESLSRVTGPRAQAALLDIARRDSNPELRMQAILWMGRHVGTAGEASSNLSRLYDDEQSEAVKVFILFRLSRLNEKEAVRKLISIARSDSSAEMRRRAVFWLNRMDDPEAVRFLKGGNR
jgi:outer membrane protein assembly factor BamD (BamD/ComL family)